MEIVPINDNNHVTPGDEIFYEEGCIPGNGILVEGNEFISCVHGTVERINKLVCVNPIRARYSGNVGDVVVGRIVSVGVGFWKVDINGKNTGLLQISSINLPDGIQRRRTEIDNLNIKTFFDVNELICAEVQSMNGQSCIQLHTRNERYGKLNEGILIQVHPSLIKRCKSHITLFKNGIKFICGMNGYIFISLNNESDYSNVGFERVARVANCVTILQNKTMHINGPIVEHLSEETVGLGIPVSLMLLKKNQELIIAKYVEEMS
ncbi:hypothetical protein ENUP19_0241G0005 [Entamoeba nuttalli]|uniref:Exosome complex exonuclease RRP4, putative n=2 Tax=Entamoeba nuttalli TaxID=412467 RepID=K2H4X7_ENTNP|nr:exosome complex exonuclease RRP4, putative [Entamoeba nuttalli P19]EKE41442.1 exosome complex exonuclease RRP4, putative [Entamoeba nuttalli P19]|eukprot:XP_008856227.1 exosome complex exonuclease RRP4, putative [Entamoeba nuttalli P19]